MASASASHVTDRGETPAAGADELDAHRPRSRSRRPRFRARAPRSRRWAFPRCGTRARRRRRARGRVRRARRDRGTARRRRRRAHGLATRAHCVPGRRRARGAGAGACRGEGEGVHRGPYVLLRRQAATGHEHRRGAGSASHSWGTGRLAASKRSASSTGLATTSTARAGVPSSARTSAATPSETATMRSARPRKRRSSGRSSRPDRRLVVAHASEGGACTVAITGMRACVRDGGLRARRASRSPSRSRARPAARRAEVPRERARTRRWFGDAPSATTRTSSGTVESCARAGRDHEIDRVPGVDEPAREGGHDPFDATRGGLRQQHGDPGRGVPTERGPGCHDRGDEYPSRAPAPSIPGRWRAGRIAMVRDSEAVTIVVPAWNAAATLDAALASVAGQSQPAAAVVVVDDGSTDSTLAVAESWCDRLPLTVVAPRCERRSRRGPRPAASARRARRSSRCSTPTTSSCPNTSRPCSRRAPTTGAAIVSPNARFWDPARGCAEGTYRDLVDATAGGRAGRRHPAPRLRVRRRVFSRERTSGSEVSAPSSAAASRGTSGCG